MICIMRHDADFTWLQSGEAGTLITWRCHVILQMLPAESQNKRRRAQVISLHPSLAKSNLKVPLESFRISGIGKLFPWHHTSE